METLVIAIVYVLTGAMCLITLCNRNSQMATQTNLVVKDDAATPKAFTLIPVSSNPPAWRGNDPVTPLAGQPRLSFTVTELKNGQFKLTAKLEVPVMETLGASGTSAGYVAPPKVAYTTTCIFSMFVDERSTVADRMNSLRMAVGILQGATATADTGILKNDDAGGAWASNTSPAVSLFQSLVLPS